MIAGTCRGRPLQAPTGSVTRPTGDRVREAIFDILGSLVDLEGAAVADLYAGSGALGIEALSRGAASCTFVDDAPAALAATTANLDTLGLAERAVVVRRDVLVFLEGEHHFDLCLCDPPYDFSAWDVLLGRLSAPVAVLETRRRVTPPAGWENIRNKRYGDTLVTVVRSLGAPQEAP